MPRFLLLSLCATLLAACTLPTPPVAVAPEAVVGSGLKAALKPGNGGILPQPDTPPVGMLPQPDTPPVAGMTAGAEAAKSAMAPAAADAAVSAPSAQEAPAAPSATPTPSPSPTP